MCIRDRTFAYPYNKSEDKRGEAEDIEACLSSSVSRLILFIDLAALLNKLFRLLTHSDRQSFLGFDALLLGVLADVLGDLH